MAPAGALASERPTGRPGFCPRRPARAFLAHGHQTINVSANGQGTGTGFFDVVPMVVTGSSGADGPRAPEGTARTRVYYSFNTCSAGTPPPANTAPSLTVPLDVVAEATGPGGAAVTFTAPASEEEDGDLTNEVVCKVGSTVVNR